MNHDQPFLNLQEPKAHNGVPEQRPVSLQTSQRVIHTIMTMNTATALLLPDAA